MRRGRYERVAADQGGAGTEIEGGGGSARAAIVGRARDPEGRVTGYVVRVENRSKSGERLAIDPARFRTEGLLLAVGLERSAVEAGGGAGGVNGYVADDEDGIQGVRGEYVWRVADMAGYASAAAGLEGIAEALRAARAVRTTSALGVTTETAGFEGGGEEGLLASRSSRLGSRGWEGLGARGVEPSRGIGGTQGPRRARRVKAGRRLRFRRAVGGGRMGARGVEPPQSCDH
jgi:hypothetical protein